MTDHLTCFLKLVRETRGKLPLNLEHLRQIRTDHNNWLVPGWVMAGPYPGVDGINFPTQEAACANLHGILKDGIDVFVSLCSELAPQSEQSPGSTACVEYFPAYVNYAYLIRRHALVAADRTITYDTLQTEDQQAPSHAGLLALLTRMLGYLRAGKRVFIHCAGGHGRTGTVNACLLVCLYGHTASLEDILRLVQHTHDLRRMQDKRCSSHIIPVRSPNSASQLQFVQRFSEFLGFATAACPGPYS